MASFSATGGVECVTCKFSGLSAAFTSSLYAGVGFADKKVNPNNVSTGSKPLPSGITIYGLYGPDGTAAGATITHTFSVSWTGTKTIYGFTEDATNHYHDINSATVTVTASGPSWPGNFSWSTVSGTYVEVTADEWNLFLSHVNEVRKYLGMTTLTFNGYWAPQGGTMYASTFTYVANVVNDMCAYAGSSSRATTVSRGDPMRKSQFTGLASALNSCR